ncbi:hypothetical protein BASA62_004471 [Batrachochytrium salamandrivorans]|nr:hypothetical protein BASA62_004471 [Batrachochytrium salamandrivorans]
MESRSNCSRNRLLVRSMFETSTKDSSVIQLNSAFGNSNGSTSSLYIRRKRSMSLPTSSILPVSVSTTAITERLQGQLSRLSLKLSSSGKRDQGAYSRRLSSKKVQDAEQSAIGLVPDWQLPSGYDCLLDPFRESTLHSPYAHSTSLASAPPTYASSPAPLPLHPFSKVQASEDAFGSYDTAGCSINSATHNAHNSKERGLGFASAVLCNCAAAADGGGAGSRVKACAAVCTTPPCIAPTTTNTSSTTHPASTPNVVVRMAAGHAESPIVHRRKESLPVLWSGLGQEATQNLAPLTSESPISAQSHHGRSDLRPPSYSLPRTNNRPHSTSAYPIPRQCPSLSTNTQSITANYPRRASSKLTSSIPTVRIDDTSVPECCSSLPNPRFPIYVPLPTSDLFITSSHQPDGPTSVQLPPSDITLGHNRGQSRDSGYGSPSRPISEPLPKGQHHVSPLSFSPPLHCAPQI